MMHNKPSDLLPFFESIETGSMFYSTVAGDVIFDRVQDTGTGKYLVFMVPDSDDEYADRLYLDRYGRNGTMGYHGECLIFPSSDNRDWNDYISKFNNRNAFRSGDNIRIKHKNDDGYDKITSTDGYIYGRFDSIMLDGRCNIWVRNYGYITVPFNIMEKI